MLSAQWRGVAWGEKRVCPHTAMNWNTNERPRLPGAPASAMAIGF